MSNYIELVHKVELYKDETNFTLYIEKPIVFDISKNEKSLTIKVIEDKNTTNYILDLESIPITQPLSSSFLLYESDNYKIHYSEENEIIGNILGLGFCSIKTITLYFYYKVNLKEFDYKGLKGVYYTKSYKEDYPSTFVTVPLNLDNNFNIELRKGITTFKEYILFEILTDKINILKETFINPLAEVIIPNGFIPFYEDSEEQSSFFILRNYLLGISNGKLLVFRYNSLLSSLWEEIGV
jgi:hypothetical protein